MGRYNSPPRDWNKRMPGKLRATYGKRKYVVITEQQGTTSFGRKKKNGCKLASSKEIRSSVAATVVKQPVVTYQVAFPRIVLTKG